MGRSWLDGLLSRVGDRIILCRSLSAPNRRKTLLDLTGNGGT